MVNSNAERAQLLLITALLIATFIMSAVVLLNLLHESPEFDTQQDSLSMSDTERVSAQLEADLQQYFYAHTSDEIVGYVDKEEFGDEINRSGSRYTNLTGKSKSGHLNVVLNADESTEGDIVYGNSSSDTDDEEQIFTDISSLTRLSFEATGDEFVSISFDVDNSSNILDISDEEVSWQNESKSQTIDWDESVEIDITDKVGEIRTDKDYIPDVQLDTDDEFNVSVEIDAWQEGGEGRFYVSSPDNREQDSGLFGEDNAIINPAFDITYTNPDIRYSSTIKLYEERDQ